MNSVERIRAICKERKIPISKLEKDLGFANAYISQLRKGVLPTERLLAVAQYLSVSPDYLLNGGTTADLLGEESKKAPTANGERSVSDDEIKFALFGGDGEITDEMYERVKQFAAFIKLEEAEKKKE